MKYRKCTVEHLEKALDIVNRKYQGNIEFKTLDPAKKSFTLQVKSSKGPGHRLGFNHPTWTTKTGKPYKPMRLIAACWHVHGNFFDALFSIAPEAYIISQNRKITKQEGNWHDWNIGSMIEPQYFSEACECN